MLIAPQTDNFQGWLQPPGWCREEPHLSWLHCADTCLWCTLISPPTHRTLAVALCADPSQPIPGLLLSMARVSVSKYFTEPELLLLIKPHSPTSQRIRYPHVYVPRAQPLTKHSITHLTQGNLAIVLKSAGRRNMILDSGVVVLLCGLLATL